MMAPRNRSASWPANISFSSAGPARILLHASMILVLASLAGIDLAGSSHLGSGGDQEQNCCDTENSWR